MKNKLPLLLVLVALFGFTATAAEAHSGPPTHYNNYYNNNYYHNHHYHYWNGSWYNDAGICVGGPGFVISFGF